MHKNPRGFILAMAFTLCGCVKTLSLDDALTMVPYQIQPSGRILVDVQLNNDGPHQFALDTAATISVVTDELRYKLEIEAIAQSSATVHGAVTSGEFPLLSIRRLQVGDATWVDAQLVALPQGTAAMSNIDGLLGIDFLRKYAVGFSAQDRVLRLYSPRSVRNESYQGWVSIPLQARRFGDSRQPLYFLDIRIGDRAVPALFDLGSSQNIMNWPAARSLRLMPVDVEDEAELSGAIAGQEVLVRFDSADVLTANTRWRNEQFLIADLEIFSTLGYSDRPLAILGSGLFQQRDFVIDFARNRLLVDISRAEIE